VIGDTGEGDSSQMSLRDQLIAASNREEVKFLVVSSDVIYPDGKMKDYDSISILPFQGVSRNRSTRSPEIMIGMMPDQAFNRELSWIRSRRTSRFGPRLRSDLTTDEHGQR
jgi:hypothetical protein